MSFTSLSVIMSVIVSNIHENSKMCVSKDQRLPKLMKKIFISHLAKFFRMEKNAKKLLRTIIKMNKNARQTTQSALMQRSMNTNDILNSNYSSDESSSQDTEQKQSCEDKMFQKIARDLFRADNDKRNSQFYSKVNSDAKRKCKCMQKNQAKRSFASKSTRYENSFEKPSKMYYNIVSENQNDCEPPVWLKRNDLNLDVDALPPKRILILKESNLNDSTMDEIYSDFSIKKSNKKQPVTSRPLKKTSTPKYRVKRENLSLYFAYEWILAGLVLVNKKTLK
jgi:hypothetical protein